jgi:hypothetical protein
LDEQAAGLICQTLKRTHNFRFFRWAADRAQIKEHTALFHSRHDGRLVMAQARR